MSIGETIGTAMRCLLAATLVVGLLVFLDRKVVQQGEWEAQCWESGGSVVPAGLFRLRCAPRPTSSKP